MALSRQLWIFPLLSGQWDSVEDSGATHALGDLPETQNYFFQLYFSVEAT